MMSKFFIFLLISALLGACTSGNSKISPTQMNITEKIKAKDSAEVWVNLNYLKSLDENISICDCWRENKYHFLIFDTNKLELFLASNLIHFGHDSQLILPLKKTITGFEYDSTSTNWNLKPIGFKLIKPDTLVLKEENKENRFVKMYFQSAKRKMNSAELSDLFYKLNSRILLKYHTIESKNSNNIIDSDTLRQLILDGKVAGHCSDDYFLDGITIYGNKTRYFEIKFNKDKVVLYENQGRGRFQKLNLGTLPKQIMHID